MITASGLPFRTRYCGCGAVADRAVSVCGDNEKSRKEAAAIASRYDIKLKVRINLSLSSADTKDQSVSGSNELHPLRAHSSSGGCLYETRRRLRALPTAVINFRNRGKYTDRLCFLSRIIFPTRGRPRP